MRPIVIHFADETPILGDARRLPRQTGGGRFFFGSIGLHAVRHLIRKKEAKHGRENVYLSVGKVVGNVEIGRVNTR